MRGFWIAVAYLLVLAALAHPLGQALPRRWFDGGRFPYRRYTPPPSYWASAPCGSAPAGAAWSSG